ncbi:hypothetical protein [Limosilactobacillus fermentum]|nr:hypothetical protein [Limosilactobacillus fermentum]
MAASVEKVTTNSTKKYSFLDYIGEPVPKSKLKNFLKSGPTFHNDLV